MVEFATRKSNHRTNLVDVLPLDTPFVLFVDPHSACNFECTFCPTGDRELIKSIGRYQGPMPIDDFEKLMDDISAFDSPIKVLRLYKDGEPLLNRNLSKMIRLGKLSSNVDSVDTTTNGALLSHKICHELVDSGLDLINISVDGLNESQFEKFTKRKIDFATYLEQVKYLYSIKDKLSIVIKTTSEIIGNSNRNLFFDTFGPFADKIFIENTAPCWPDFDVESRMNIEINEGLYGNEVINQTACPYLFYSMSVNSDMSVSACFVDWSRDLIIGDARKDSLKNIWTSDEFNTHRINHLMGRRRTHPICGGCGQISHCGADLIEADLSLMLKKMEETLDFSALTLDSLGYGNIIPVAHD
jgi:MoaA/NifB/PqqE/SkfB family radical SAM enzyme